MKTRMLWVERQMCNAEWCREWKEQAGGGLNGLDATCSSPGVVLRVAVGSHEQRLRPCVVVHAGHVADVVGVRAVPKASTPQACKIVARLRVLQDHSMQSHLSAVRSLHPHSWEEELLTHGP